MATPSTRTPVRIARGSYSNLNSSLSDLQDGEIMYAEDQDKLYIKEGSSLVVLTQPAANAVFTGNVTVNAQGDLRLADSDSSNYVGFQSPATVSANVVWTLPDADSSGTQFLRSNGSGTLSWGSVDLTSYAPLASPTLTGTPAAPTASANTSTTQIATTAFVMTELGDYLTTATAASTYAPLAGPAFTGTATGVNLTLSGNLTVNGTTTTIDTTNLDVEDKNITIGKVSTPSDATADGGGLTLKGATDKTWNWVDSTDAWTSSEHIKLASGKTFIGDGSTLTALNASNIASGTIAAARVPTLNQNTTGSAATATTATNVTVANETSDTSCNVLFTTSATGDQAPKSASTLTFNSSNGRLFATTFQGNGSLLTNMMASQITVGTINTARLGSGTASSSTFLRGDGTWAGAGVTSDAQYNTAAGTNAGDSFSGTSAVNNTLFGYDAGTAITSGDDNTCVGYKSAPVMDTGEKNIVVGSNSALALAGGSRNVVLGYEALKLSTGAYAGIYIGFQAGKEMTNGAGNVVIGNQAGVSTTSAAGSVFIGDSSGQNVYTGDNNICIGKNTFGGNSMANNIVMGYRAGGFMAGSGVEHNIFMGYEAAYGNSGGSGRANNIGMGYRALYDLTTGDHNICMGNGAGDEITTGASNIGIGQLSLGGWDQATAGTGSNNVAIGQKCMGKWTTGGGNVCVGYQAGEDLTTGGNNVFIGASASRTTANGSTCNYSISIGEGSKVRNGSNNIAIGNNADCGVGNTNTIALGNTSITSFSVPGVSLSATSSGVSDAKGNLRSVPTRNETSAYTLVAADAGKCVVADNGVTVPNGVFAAGDVITIINGATSNKTITQGSGLAMRNVGDDGSTGNVSIKQYAMCTLIFTASSVCFFSTTAKA
jgi:hypothetical protein